VGFCAYIGELSADLLLTARYVDVRLERKKEVLDKYHTAVHNTKKEPSAGEPTKKPKKKSNDIDL